MNQFFFVSLVIHVGLYFFMIDGQAVHLPENAVEVELTEFKFAKVISNSAQLSKKLTKEVSVQDQVSSRQSLSQEAQSKAHYLSQIFELVKNQQTYPTLSKKLKEQGLVKVLLTIDSSGTLKKVELIEGTPFKRLNDAAMQAAVRAAPFQPFPSEVQSDSWKIAIPVQFSLY